MITMKTKVTVKGISGRSISEAQQQVGVDSRKKRRSKANIILVIGDPI